MGDADAVRAAARLLHSDSDQVRRASMSVLSALALRGDRVVVDAALECIRHDNRLVRCDGLRMITRFASGKDSTIPPAVACCLGDEETEVQRLAGRALRRLLRETTVQCQVQVVQAMAASLRSQTFNPLGCGAERLLVQLAEMGGVDVEEAIMEHLGPGYARFVSKAVKPPNPCPVSSKARTVESLSTEDSDGDGLSSLQGFDSEDLLI